MLLSAIFSERLIFTNLNYANLEGVWNIWKNPINKKYMSEWIHSREELVKLVGNLRNRPGYIVVARDKISGDLIGTCSFGETNRRGTWGIGYCIDEPYWNQAYGSEMVYRIIDYIRLKGGLELVAETAIENIYSIRILEKVGMIKVITSEYKQIETGNFYESNIYKMKL